MREYFCQVSHTINAYRKGALSLFFCADFIHKGIPVTDIYYGISWFYTVLAIVLLVVGLWNATLLPSEKGYYAFAFLLALFGAIAVQKNTRDSQDSGKRD